MAVTIDQVLREAAARGIHYMGGAKPTMLASDSVPGMITSPNGSIPANFTTVFDPEIARVALAPLKSESIYSSRQMGSWIDTDIEFPIVEHTGQATAYGDYDNDGTADSNVVFENRQTYHFQTHVKVGEMGAEKAARIGYNIVGEKQGSGVDTLNRLRNKINFFGVEGLNLRGSLNDKDLPAPITPTNGTKWSDMEPEKIVNEALRMFADAQKRSDGTLSLDDPMTLALSPNMEPILGRTNSYGLDVKEQLTKKFSKMRIETAPEYATANGELVQLIPDSVRRSKTGQSIYTERLRFHRVELRTSNWSQKLSAGSVGTVIKYPHAISQMIGV